MISHIAALSRNRVIGNKGQLPWHLPEDLKYFKTKTLDQCVIMGRKTFVSIGKPLPKRENIVITRDPTWTAPGCHALTSVEKAITFCQKEFPSKDIFIAGGGEIFSQTLEHVDRLYLTLIDMDIAGDAYYPDWRNSFKEVFRETHKNDEFSFSFCVFDKKP